MEEFSRLAVAGLTGQTSQSAVMGAEKGGEGLAISIRMYIHTYIVTAEVVSAARNTLQHRETDQGHATKQHVCTYIRT